MDLDSRHPFISLICNKTEYEWNKEFHWDGGCPAHITVSNGKIPKASGLRHLYDIQRQYKASIGIQFILMI